MALNAIEGAGGKAAELQEVPRHDVLQKRPDEGRRRATGWG